MCNKIQMLSDRSLLIDTLIFLPVKLFNFFKEKYSNVIGNKASSNLDLHFRMHRTGSINLYLIVLNSSLLYLSIDIYVWPYLALNESYKVTNI